MSLHTNWFKLGFNWVLLIDKRMTHQRSHHHRKSSSISSISPGVTGDSERIERFQAFNQWRFEQAELCMDFVVSGVIVHLGHNFGFIIECTSPSGHWLTKKTIDQVKAFQKRLEQVYPVEAGKTGRPRIIPKLPCWPVTQKILELSPSLKRYYKRKLQKFMDQMLTRSLLIARSRVFEEFLRSNCVEVEESDEQNYVHGLYISSPKPKGNVLKCINVDFPSKSNNKFIG